ncbi:DNA phosphorothioation-dependent restriction protein DptG [Fictibacillus nanhaiensis]|uniref:DNA phosphorothioation-dependent restriction protein DptG n=1 Tax=Fictibacillus nanhaiensis TaxID=742169 RepID=UPI001C97A108|nr:DNA phosphorothioation-dependent restriction protein DptG [Fictibacillus nanhaiensis]MBY6036649.1 DNA phosphorothioation-dependent restriction protein DptG [Fictibacillus nanhaiensis]
MDQILLKNELENNIKKKTKGTGVIHERGNVKDILPFNSSKKTKLMKDNYLSMMGAFVREICDVKLENNKKPHDIFEEDNVLIANLLSQVRCNDDDITFDLKRFLNQYLFNEEQIKPIHPYLYNHIPHQSKAEEEKFAMFMYDILIKDDNALKKIFNKENAEDILTDLILGNLSGIQPVDHQKKNKYQVLSKRVSNLFNEDVLYLSKHKDYFLEHFPLLVHFYFFMYVCQITIKLDQFETADMEEIESLYFALEWESINKRRKSADELEGYKRVKNRAHHLFVHIHTLSQLSHLNFNNGDEKEFLTYQQIIEKVELQGADQKETFLVELTDWINYYTTQANIKFDKRPDSIEEAFRILFDVLKQGMSTQVCIKYGSNIEDIGGNQFLKHRGSLGKVFNISHDLFLLLASICIKEERIPLNQLFSELETRGVSLDRHSKKAAIELLDSLNIIDKKSDSGDAQYVKPIL